MRLSLFLYLSIISLISCKDDDTTQSSEIKVADIKIATGVLLTDENGQGIGSVGNPNWYNGLILYPNPSADVQTAALQAGEISEIHIIPAEKNTDFSRTEVMTTFNTFEGYASAEIQSNSLRSITGFMANQQIQYRIDGLAPGYYRVIATSVSGEQHGSTIFVDSTLTFPTALRDFLIADWP